MTNKILGEYFLPDTADRLSGIATGNSAKAVPRDLSMRKKEYWETRPSPAKPHHWTASEFDAHLEKHRFPPNTLRDRLVWHQESIRRALVLGEFVPPEVLSTEEGVAAVADAIMEVKALDSGAYRTEQQNQAVQEFSAVLGETLEARRIAIEQLVLDGVKLTAQAQGGDPQPIAVEGYPRPIWCLFHDGRAEIKDTGWGKESLFGTLIAVDRGTTESIVRKAILQGDVSFDDSLWSMGSGWRPFAVVHSSDSPRG